MHNWKWVRGLAVNGFLLAVLVSFLLLNQYLTRQQPQGLFTPAQRDYLNLQESRKIVQPAPSWRTLLPGGQAAPAEISEWHNRVRARLVARFDEQEGVGATVYALNFTSEYQLSYSGPEPDTTVELIFPFPPNLVSLHDVVFLVDGTEPEGVSYSPDQLVWQTRLAAGEPHHLLISYQADGANSFVYALNRDQRLDVDVTIEVIGPPGSRTAENSLDATEATQGDMVKTFRWEYSNLIPNRDIRVELPARLSFVQRVAQLQDEFQNLARVSPFLVVLLLVSFAALFYQSGLILRLEVYLLAGWGLALFFPLLTFLSGFVAPVLAAMTAFITTAGLVLTYMGLVGGWQQTWRKTAWLLFLVLGIFSVGQLTPWRGLLLSTGSLLLVGTIMFTYLAPGVRQASAHPIAASFPSTRGGRHCVTCGGVLAPTDAYCPGCGSEAQICHTCPDCGYEQLVLSADRPVHCLHCGAELG